MSPMPNQLSELESRVDLLLQACTRLQQENATLQRQLANARERENQWLQERSRLNEKNELARSRVESMITRLKHLEEPS